MWKLHLQFINIGSQNIHNLTVEQYKCFNPVVPKLWVGTPWRVVIHGGGIKDQGIISIDQIQLNKAHLAIIVTKQEFDLR